MLVVLKRAYHSRMGKFVPGIPKGTPVEMPDELSGELPSDAKMWDDDKPVPVVVEPVEPVTLAEAADHYGVDAMEKAASDQMVELQNKASDDAEAERNEKAAKFQADLEAENSGDLKKAKGKSK